jgi:hypothetical protein
MENGLAGAEGAKKRPPDSSFSVFGAFSRRYSASAKPVSVDTNVLHGS